MSMIKNGLMLTTILIAVYQDIKYKKIKNYLTISIILVGLILSIFEGIESITDSLFGICLPFFICSLFYILKMLGAGDVKLYCALGSVMGKVWIINCMMLSILFGGALALLIMIFYGILFERLKYLFNYLKNLILMQEIIPYQDFTNSNKATFPYAIAIAFGGVMSFWIHIL